MTSYLSIFGQVLEFSRGEGLTYNSRVMITTLFFDLDDTLYNSGSGLWPAIGERMSKYMHERVGLSWEVIPALREEYYHTYGTTLRGLQRHYGVDADDYLEFVHDLPVDQYIQPSPELRALLLSLPQKRWIFTNADDMHARRVTAALGVADCFSGIIDVRAIDFACKPEEQAYLRALACAGENAAQNCVVLDDSPVNLYTASQLGFHTVLVGSDEPPDGITHAIPHLLDLPGRMPELWLESARPGSNPER